MSPTERVLSDLMNGGWVLSLLEKSFRFSLNRRLSSELETKLAESLPTTWLAAVAYHVVSPALANELPRLEATYPYYIQKEDKVGPALAQRVNPRAKFAEVDFNTKILVENGLTFIGDVCSQTAHELTLGFRAACYLRRVSFRGASHPHAFGCFFLGEGFSKLDLNDAAVSIVHELAHQELFLINLIDRLGAGDDLQIEYSPFQRKARPTIGRLHSAHALYRMVQFKKRVGMDSEFEKDCLSATIRTFKPNHLTPFAWSMTQECYQKVC